MKFSEVVAQTLAWLQRDGRISYRALKREFDLDNDYIEDLKEEVIRARRLAIDEDGAVLVWVGNSSPASSVQSLESKEQRWTPTDQTLDARRQTLDSAAERRQLTVMFCDLVGSTALSEQLDPEEYREVVRSYQQTSAAVIERFEGHLAQYLGDGLLVYFGYPIAHEDDAARAVRAGLEIIEALRKPVPSLLEGETSFSPSPSQGEGSASGASAGEGSVVVQSYDSSHPNPPPKGAREIHLRIGIHTGLVVIGEIGSSERREMLALGETPNIAARVQGMANPDEVVISTATHRLVEGLFECEDRGNPELKGISTSMTLYHVVKEGEAHSRFQVIARKGLTPLVGREHEYGLLQERWAQVKDGAGQVVLLSGEPGIGKSRLVEALKESLTREGTSCLELRCSPYHQNSALYPVIEHLQHMLEFQPDDSSEEKLQKLIVGAHSSAPLQAETIALLAALLSLPHPEGYPALTFSPQKQKEKTYEALVAWLCGEAKQHAMMYVWEDLHWADPSTLELLTLFLAQVPTTRLLAVLTFRPEFTSPWGSHSYLSQLTLSRLGRTHIETMVKRVTGDTALPTELVQQIVSKTDGVPLFVEELTKSVVESIGAHSRMSLQLGIPATLQDALMARLDRLGTAKEIAQLGATLGREFTYEVLHAASPLNEETLQQGLRQLVETELVFQSGVPPQARYLFKHALVQDTAYQSLLKSTRQQCHKQIAQILKTQFLQTVETQPELVAHHYTKAGLIERAIPYWQKAGQRAVQHSAHVEAISHLTKGLELLKTRPNTPQRSRQELTLQIALGPPLQYTKGYGAPEVEQTYNRALALCRQIGDTSLLFSCMSGLHSVYMMQRKYHLARTHAEQFLRLTENVHDPALLLLGHQTLGISLYPLGELSAARAYFEQGLAWHNPQHPFPTSVSCLSHLNTVLWLLGYPDQALGRVREALAVAQRLSLSFWIGSALHFTTQLHYRRREERTAYEQAEAVMTLSTEQGFPFWLGWATLFRGGALVAQGQSEIGLRQVHQGLDTLRAMGSVMSWSAALSVLAEAYGKVGQSEAGLNVLIEALAVVDQTGERYYEAELYRLKGELLLARESTEQGARSREHKQSSVVSSQSPVPSPQHLTPNTQAEAEECFLKAIAAAQKQQAKSWELRAATSLARLWQSQGKKAQAHKLLSEIYNWFTEGFDTKDLQEAKALIEGLNH